MRQAVAIAAALLAIGSKAEAQDLSWMAGYWLSCSADQEVSETWSDPRADVMLGTTFTLRGGQPSWEYARIGRSGEGFSFFAQPTGQAAAEFRATEMSARHVVFENPTHDFPQRVIYRRTGDRLTGKIEGTINGAAQSAEWHYVRADLNARCPAD